ncbi:MAG: hypothetical protein H0V70_09665 [Ktedonobacteraceae bacterium]|nr:hypothetical protein [Ktedonobacteraceae bacterium]
MGHQEICPDVEPTNCATTLLLSRSKGLNTVSRRIELPVNLIIRESCGAQLHVERARAAH